MTTPPAAANKSAAEMIIAYFRDFRVLKETRREYWAIQIINFLDSMFYFALLSFLTLFLSHEIGLDDIHANWCFALCFSVITLLLFVSGMWTDWFGIKKSLMVCLVAMLFLRLAMVGVVFMPALVERGLLPKSLLEHRGLVCAGLLVLIAPFMAGVQTAFQSACQRYTTKRSRGAGFNLWYLFMNLGAAAGCYLMDVFRLDWHWSHAYMHIFTMGAVTAVLSLIVGITMIRTDEQLVSPDEPAEEAKEDAKVEHKKPWQTFMEVIREPALWRLIVLIALILGVRAIYTYNAILMPKYWERTIGEDAAIGVLNTINPIGIVIGLILFIPIANRFNVFNMLVYGAMISCFSLLPMSLPWEWYGMGIAKAHYVMAILCMVILTIGEIIWSPKLNEYTAAIAPKGQEGTYLGLSMLPWFVAKTLASFFSGYMLARWSPETVTVNGAAVPLQQAMINGQLSYWDSPAAMWFYLGIYALAGCIGALLLRGWLTRGAHWNVEHK